MDDLVTVSDLANEFDVEPAQIRHFLLAHFGKTEHPANTRVHLTVEQVDYVRAQFARRHR